MCSYIKNNDKEVKKQQEQKCIVKKDIKFGG